MTGPDHSKKPKSVTIDLPKEDIRVADDAQTTEAAIETDAAPIDSDAAYQTSPPSPPVKDGETRSAQLKGTGSGVLAKAGAGLLGGLIALTGAAGLQYFGMLPSLGSNAEVASLSQKVSDLAAKPAFDPAPLQAALDGANAEIASLKEQIAQLPAEGATADLGPINEKIAALEAAMTSMSAGGVTADPSSAAAIKTLSDKVAALETAAPSANGASAVALAIAASGLKAAIDRGGPFPAELETYASVAPTSPDLEALRVLAGSGVPSQAELVAGFNEAANAMIAAATVVDPNAGILQRLTESATKLVKARRVGDIKGDEPDAIVARMEMALNRGDLETVIAESGKLPEASRAAGKPWTDRVIARRDANSLVTRGLGQALTAAGGKS